jgi:hypothetical protein
MAGALLTLGLGSFGSSPLIVTGGLGAFAPPVVVAGPYCIDAAQLYFAGAIDGQVYRAGAAEGELYHAGILAGEVYVAGAEAEVYRAGSVAGQGEC